MRYFTAHVASTPKAQNSGLHASEDARGTEKMQAHALADRHSKVSGKSGLDGLADDFRYILGKALVRVDALELRLDKLLPGLVHLLVAREGARHAGGNLPVDRIHLHHHVRHERVAAAVRGMKGERAAGHRQTKFQYQHA
eukprot:TRINITY_DN2919_c1_g1_i1.p4 TRINITY_DN2919_c1_g1~~TRINITY_DN2919_c1_g1_i1.p4  ORF type:complete len:140 (+),score=15.31 TRINITY_DN2919_c1_g1_i1:424-843(+)